MSRILIVEDEKNLSRFVELELQHEGYEAEVCKNGRQGLEMALDEDWDAVHHHQNLSDERLIHDLRLSRESLNYYRGL